jgi:hypothetical protein
MGAINRGVWPAKSIGQALFFYGMFCLSCSLAWSSDTSEQRVAAIISSGDNSMVLIEDGAGEQNWHRVGEFVGDSRVDYIDPNWIRLSTPDGDVRLYLRGDKYDENETQSGASTEEPPREVSRNYDFRNLISRVDSATADVGGVSEQARSRNLNEVFDLAERAKITAINKVEVSTAAEAGAELREQLLQKGAIRITVDNAYTKVLYVSPEP